ncbi:MAG: type II toxin-antitoxin system RelE/ParE family toxin [Patescibacteria group bacterium]
MNSNKSWVLQVDDTVYKFLARIPRRDSKRILFVIQDLPHNPFRGNIQKMKGESNVWRKRVGSYRIRYELIPQEKVIHVFLAERRTSSSY